jgi:L-lactate dehydrogenase complex protein LldG
MPKFTGWGYSKDLPRFAGKTFRERFVAQQVEEKVSEVNTYIETPVDRYTGTQGDEEVPVRETVRSDRDALISQFAEELTKVNGSVIRTSPNELSSKVIDFLQARAIGQIHLEPGVLDETALQQAGISMSHTADAALPVGITTTICGLADTGSILVADGEGEPLRASLLPAIHIAILRASDILPSLADAMSLPGLREAKAVVVITGPSRTADIEMSLTIGMHGPGELHVFLVHGTASTLVDD